MTAGQTTCSALRSHRPLDFVRLLSQGLRDGWSRKTPTTRTPGRIACGPGRSPCH